MLASNEFEDTGSSLLTEVKPFWTRLMGDHLGKTQCYLYSMGSQAGMLVINPFFHLIVGGMSFRQTQGTQSNDIIIYYSVYCCLISS